MLFAFTGEPRSPGRSAGHLFFQIEFVEKIHSAPISFVWKKKKVSPYTPQRGTLYSPHALRGINTFTKFILKNEMNL
jgi:hypothetical protein